MKKILLMFTLTVGAMLQAAAIDWCTFGSPLKDAESNALNGIAYLVNTSVTVDRNFLKSNENAIVGDAVVANGKIELKTSTANLTLNTVYDFYLIVFNAATIDDATAYMMSGVWSASAYDNSVGNANTTTLNFGFPNTDGSGSLTNSTWVTIVPEPTVLALLALGVAGLALKRKVA